ncbi:MAG: secreted hydrolase-like protein [Chloroflexi bacterium OLB15]|nr:MAG: secreted hydrolase-like protein [Chloroflexi bacterium OLB15]
MRRWIALALIAIAIVAAGFSLLEPAETGEVSASAIIPEVSSDTAGFSRAVEPYDWQFPQDYGAHPEFQTEWWYYTGNLADENGRHFGFQFTIFRRAISPNVIDSASEWRSNQLYMAHFAITDVDGGQYFHEQRFSREGANLAGAECTPRCTVWVENWVTSALDDESIQTQISAAGTGYALNLNLTQIKPPALQGDNGLSAKSDEPGNASYYYSLTRLLSEGTITIGDQAFEVTGFTWMDHEFSTSALGSNARGWDWFGLQLDDNRELMLGQIRLNDGGIDPNFGGILVQPDGTTHTLSASAMSIQSTATWTSPHSGAVYPAGWEISVDIGEDEPLRLQLTPLLADQELYGGGITYWEGAVRISGDAAGYGYAELTGYVDSMTGRF